MVHSFSYLNTSKQILETYKGDTPFATWLKEFFRKNKKFGSKDRKHITHLCYCYFRTAKALSHLDVEQQIIWSLFLCSNEPGKLLEGLNAELNALASPSIKDRIEKSVEVGFSIEAILPWAAEVSNQIEHLPLCKSFLVQPDLFLRLRPGKQKKVCSDLITANILFEKVHSDCIRLSNNTKIDELLSLDRDAVVQDLSSQQTLDVLQHVLSKENPIKAWDCCAASGGKSLLLHDLYPNVSILATDIRSSILANLQKRFEKAGIKNYRSQVHDVSQHALKEKFDVVICDAPCSGSGTWSRTPEQLHFFEKGKIDHYVDLQKKIALNASMSVKKGGYFVYITCSVFSKENEEVVQMIKEKTALQLVSSNYIKGYDIKADTLFTALFQS